MSLSLDTQKRIEISLTSQSAGGELASAVNNGSAIASQSPWVLPAVIVAAHVSSTTDFAALKVGDQVVHIPAVAGNAIFYTVVTAGTLPAAAVVGDLYVAIRASVLPAPVSVKL